MFFSGSRIETSNREKGFRAWHAPCLGTGRWALSERHTNQSFTAMVKSYSARAWICHCAYCSVALLEKADKSKQEENLLFSLFLMCRVNPEGTFHRQGTHAVVHLKLTLLISFNKWGNKNKMRITKGRRS